MQISEKDGLLEHSACPLQMKMSKEGKQLFIHPEDRCRVRFVEPRKYWLLHNRNKCWWKIKSRSKKKRMCLRQSSSSRSSEFMAGTTSTGQGGHRLFTNWHPGYVSGSRCFSSPSWTNVQHTSGVYILPKNWVFYKSLFGASSFFINNNGQFFIKRGSFFYKKVRIFMKFIIFWR